jgi:hypothetical protein
MGRPRGKSEFLIKETHAEIVCKHGNFIIDLEDVEKAKTYKWFSKLSNGNYYAYSHYQGNSKISLHRFILEVSDSRLVDHKNRNTFDTRKENLRICNRFENNRNAKKNKRGKVMYKGVTIRPSGRFGVYIQNNGKPECLGTYDSEIEAALRYNERAKDLFGEFANLNKIGEENE